MNSGQVGEQTAIRLSIHCSMALIPDSSNGHQSNFLRLMLNCLVSQPVTSLGKERGFKQGAQHDEFLARQLGHFLWRLKDTTEVGGMEHCEILSQQACPDMPPKRSVISQRETGFFARSDVHCILCEKQFGSKPLNCRDMDRVFR